MITITRERDGWRCVIELGETPAKYYAVNGAAVDSPHVVGIGRTPHLALDAAELEVGRLTISNPVNAGR